eukprot:m.306095 g.306095  ORF g.306095 m.306095 type:complete len:865 (+) comp40965_c0_seq1:140-2734(+)
MTRISILGGILLSVLVTWTQGNDEEAVYFSPNSEPLRRETWLAGKSGSLVFSFKTVNPSGLLVYQGGVADSGHSLAVGLQNGVFHLIFSGDGDHVKVPHDQGRKRTDDGDWHDVRVDVNTMSFSVDGVSTDVSFPSNGFQFDGVFWIGGVGQDVTVHPLLTEAFGTGYEGCFGGLHFSADPISVIEIANNNPEAMVTIGCPKMAPSTEAPEESCGDSTEVRFEGGDSYLCLEPFSSMKKSGQISFQFKTAQSEAQLLFTKGKKNDVLSVYLEGGSVLVRMDVGGGSSMVNVGNGLNDDMWHSVLISKEETGTLVLKVDGASKSVELLKTSGGNTYWEAEGNLCFGGTDAGEGEKPSLVGCAKMITTRGLIDKPISIAVASSNVKAGCCSPAEPSTQPPPPTTMKPSTAGPTTPEAVTTQTAKVTTEAVEVKTTTESSGTTEMPMTAKASTTQSSSADCSPDDEDCDDEGSATSEPPSTEAPSTNVKIVTRSPRPTQTATTEAAATTQTLPCDDEDGCEKTDEPMEGSASEMPTSEEVTPTGPCDDEDNCPGSGDTPSPSPSEKATATPKVTVAATTEPVKTVTRHTADFDEDDSIKFTPDEPIKTDNLNLQLNFQTDQDEAALMFLEADKDSGVLVHITDGKVALSIVDPDVSSSKRRRRALSGTTFLSDEKINDGKAHEVGAKIGGGGVSTTVDNNPPVQRAVNVQFPDEVSNVQVGQAPGLPGFVGQMSDVGVGDVNVMKEASNPDDPRFSSTVVITPVEVPVEPQTPKPSGTDEPNIITDDKLTDGIDDEDKGGMSGGALAGAIIGAVLGVLVVTALLVFVIIHYQRRDEGSYTLDEESSVKNGCPNNAKAAEAEGKEWYM